MGWSSKFRLTVEVTTALLATALLTASLISPDWVEKAFGLVPDGGDGAAEWATSFGAAAVFLVATLLARKDWRELRHAEVSGTSSSG